MNRRQKIIVSVVGIFIVLLALVGLTYAYFLTQITGNTEDTSITVTTANLELVYEDGNGVLTTDTLVPSNDYITFKNSSGTVESKIFTVTNNGNATVEGYKVYLENVQNQLVRKDDLVYTLTCTSYSNYGETDQAISGTCTGVETETTFPDVMTSIVSNDINVGITHVYELKAKYKEMGVDQSIDMNKKFSAKINIYDGNTQFLARNIIDNAKSNLNGTSLVLDGSAESKVGVESSAYTVRKVEPTKYPLHIDNAGGYYIAYACDYTVTENYNGSAYFTLGTDECPVTKIQYDYNNEEHVKALQGKYAYWYYGEDFSVEDGTGFNELYKITNGNNILEGFDYAKVVPYVSTEKIIATTYDDYGTSYYYRGGPDDNYVTFANMCWRIMRIQGDGSIKLILEDNNEPCSSNMNADWRISNPNSEYGGWNFGYREELVYNEQGTEILYHKPNYLNSDGTATDYKNSMATAFKNFQTTDLKDYLDDLKPGDWCLGDKAYKQLVTSKVPTLKCLETKMTKWGDNETEMYVGTLTENEYLYLGGRAYGEDFNYLNSNISFWQSYWTLTLSGNNGSDSDLVNFILGDVRTYVDCCVGAQNEVYMEMDVRPSIILKSSITITNGDGTINNPYIIG